LPLWRAEKASKAEVEWFFGAMHGKVPGEGEAEPSACEAAKLIQGWLAAIPTFCKGALALRFTPRPWPKALVGAFGEWTSLVVRLACSRQESDKPRSIDEAEADAARGLLDAIAANRDGRERQRLQKHAQDHVSYAFRSYLRVRGVGPSPLPVSTRGAP
jgi:hypothetical protein